MKTQTSVLLKLVTVSEMVAIEKEANQNGLSYSDMINNAGAGLANTIIVAYSHLKDRKVLGLIGKGNNGGDTLIALSELQKHGWDTVAYIVGDRSEDDEALKSYVEAQGKVVLNKDEKRKNKLKSELNSAGILLDGLLGTGIRLPLKPPISSVLKNVNKMLETVKLRPIIVAVDCPSGMNCDSGEIAEESVPADITVCMAAVKVGMLKLPAFEHVGKIEVVDIGLISKIKKWEAINSWVINEEMIQELLPNRRTDGHKGTFGIAMVVGGSQIYSGAARLAGEAAHRVGAGLVSMCVPEQVYLTQAGHLPEAIWTVLPDVGGYIHQSGVNIVRERLDSANALLIGPGLGLEVGAGKFIEELIIGSFSNKQMQGLITQPEGKHNRESLVFPAMVIDADGLKLLHQIDQWWLALPANCILTPHPGEMAILTGLTVEDIQKDRTKIAKQYSQEWGHIVVLKGAMSIVASPDGSIYVLPFSNSVLAHAGTGDVLAGMITGLLAQGVDNIEAVLIGMWVHAQSAMGMLEQIGSERSVLARDLLDGIGKVLGIMESKKGHH